MAKTTVLLCLWILVVQASDPLGGLASAAPADIRIILQENGVLQRVVRLPSGDTRVIQLEKSSPEFRKRRDAAKRAYRDAAKRAAEQSAQLAPLSHRIGWIHVPKSGTSFGTSLAHLANASLPRDAAIGLAPSAQRR